MIQRAIVLEAAPEAHVVVSCPAMLEDSRLAAKGPPTGVPAGPAVVSITRMTWPATSPTVAVGVGVAGGVAELLGLKVGVAVGERVPVGETEGVAVLLVEAPDDGVPVGVSEDVLEVEGVGEAPSTVPMSAMGAE